MQRREVTRKGTIYKKLPEKALQNIRSEESSSSMSEISTDILIQTEPVTPNPVKKTSRLKGYQFSGFSKACIQETVIPAHPFGPKATACIIPCKNLSENAQALEMDVLENYNIWSDIGKGSYATVKLATHKITVKKCAIKIYSKKSLEDPTLKKNVNREIKILKKINHHNIVEFYEEINGKNNLYIVMEYVKGISLSNHLTTKGLKRLDEGEACEIFTQLISALDYCHSRNITHRDIKLENIQLDLHFNVKLIDFGFATCFSNQKKSLIFCGSPSYMAPEIINKQEFSGPPVDIWAAGIVLYLLVTGSFPFKSNVEQKVFDKIKKGDFIVPDYVSSLCKDLIVSILNPCPDRRPSASLILRHSWIASSAGTAVYAFPNSGDNIEVLDEDEDTK